MKLYEEFKLYENMWDSVEGEDKEYVITYRLTTWPDSAENEDAFLYAESEEDARENFLNHMFDVDNYDADDVDNMPTEDEIKIISIRATGK